VASILGITINNEHVVPMRNHWFEYLDGGYGIRTSCNSSEIQLFDEGEACTFDDIASITDTTLKVYSTETEAANTRVLLQGYDENGVWITSLDSGTVIDGEYLTISETPNTVTESTNKFSAITGFQKPVTNGPIYLQRSSVSQGDANIGYYEWDETNPIYRRSKIPGLGDMPQFSCSDGTPLTNRRTIRAMVKLKHIDVVRDTDWFILRNVEAFKLGMQAVRFEDAEKLDDAARAWALAEDILSRELEHYQGTANIVPVRAEPELWGAGEVGNLI
jgi:hypothetical protein